MSRTRWASVKFEGPYTLGLFKLCHIVYLKDPTPWIYLNYAT